MVYDNSSTCDLTTYRKIENKTNFAMIQVLLLFIHFQVFLENVAWKHRKLVAEKYFENVLRKCNMYYKNLIKHITSD